MTPSTPPGGASRAPAACRLGLAGAMTLPFLFSPAPAFAAINPVPAVPKNVVVFPERDFVEAEGYAPDTALEFRVLRNGVRIGSATGTTTVDGTAPGADDPVHRAPL